MPRRIEGVTEKLIEAARQEFLENGFEGASIRTIAAKAETSPRERCIPDLKIRKNCFRQ